MDSTPSQPKSLTRFSLLTLVLLTTIVALAISVAVLYRELSPLRAEVRQLRDEAGYLTIVDRSKFHAIAIQTGSPLVWKWRVWIPEGQTKVRLNTGVGEIPAANERNYPPETVWYSCDRNQELIFVVRVYYDVDGRWKLGLSGDTATPFTWYLSDAQVAALRDSSGMSHAGVGSSTTIFDGDAPVVLLRQRTIPQDAWATGGVNPEAAGPGIFVCLDVDDQP